MQCRYAEGGGRIENYQRLTRKEMYGQGRPARHFHQERTQQKEYRSAGTAYMDESVQYDITMQNSIKNGLFGGEGLFLATLAGPGDVWLQSLPFNRMAGEIVKAAHSSSGSQKGAVNNPVGEVSDGIGNALGGLFKF